MSRRKSSFVFVLLFLAEVISANAGDSEQYPSNAVTFFGTVNPDSYQTVLTAKVGEKQISAGDLADLIRVNTDRVLRITSIQGFVFGSPNPPTENDYALALVAACSPTFSLRGFGNADIAFSGPKTVQLNFHPGPVVSLLEGEQLCLRSNTQSNKRVRIEVHGYLMQRPSVAKTVPNS